MQKMSIKIQAILATLLVLFVFTSVPVFAQSSTNPQNGATGLTGTVPRDPPTQGATITFPNNGATFTNPSVGVTGVCPTGLLVKIFKNEVFAGSVVCTNGSFSIDIDLFSGTNQIVARVYDELDQPGPDSNTVTVTYDDGNGAIGSIDRLLLTTNFAKRGANPGEKLRWPITVSGGTGPYAISVDWGDGNESLLSLDFAGEFTVDHIYETAGTYKIIVKATDANGTSTFLQLVGVANGALQDQPARTDENGQIIQTTSSPGLKIVMWPLYVMLFLIISTFWIGRRYEIKKLKRKLANQQSLS
jgi:hypothetical protein